MDFNRIFNGMIRAMRLDKTFFEEVEHDTSYNQDALWRRDPGVAGRRRR